MRVAYAFPVRGVEALADGTYLAVGIETNLFPVPSLPAQLTVSLVLCVVATPMEVDEELDHQLVLRVLNPDLGHSVPPFTVGLRAMASEALPEGSESRMLLTPTVQFEATMAGFHSIEISVDDAPPVSVNLLVRVVGEDPSPDIEPGPDHLTA